MGIKERRERERQYVRSMIMKIVNRLVASGGWNGVTIRKIAEEIEYSPPIVYEHFESKDALLRELKREAYEKLLKYFKKIEEGGETGGDLFIELSAGFLEFCVTNKGYGKALMGLDGVPAISHDDLPEWLEVRRFLLTKTAAALNITDSASPAVVDTFDEVRCLMRGAISRVLSQGEEMDQERMVYLIKEGAKHIVEGNKRRPAAPSEKPAPKPEPKYQPEPPPVPVSEPLPPAQPAAPPPAPAKEPEPEPQVPEAAEEPEPEPEPEEGPPKPPPQYRPPMA